MPSDEEEQSLPLVPLRNKRMSWVKLKSYSLKVTVFLGRRKKSQERDWWSFLGSSWISVYLNLTNQMHTQKRPVQEPKGILFLQLVCPCRSNPWIHGYAKPSDAPKLVASKTQVLLSLPNIGCWANTNSPAMSLIPPRWWISGPTTD